MRIIRSSVILMQFFYLTVGIENFNSGENDKIECSVTMDKGISLQRFWLKGHRPVAHIITRLLPACGLN